MGMTKRESVETTELVCIRHSTGLTDQGRARDAAGLPTSAADEGPTEEAFELHDSETRQSVIDSLRREAARFAPGASRQYTHDAEAAMEVCNLLLHFADRVEQIDETVGELLARTGLDEGDRLEIRFPTVAEDRAKLAKVLRDADQRKAQRGQVLKNDGSTRCTVCGGFTLHFEGCVADPSVHRYDGPDPEVIRDAHGAPVEPFPSLNDEQEIC